MAKIDDNIWVYYYDLIDQAYEVLNELKIPYADKDEISFDISNTRRNYGDCTAEGGGYFKIRIAKRVLSTYDDKTVLQTIIHEILHTSAWGDGHRGKWKKYAKKVSDNTEYKIQRCATKEEVKIVNDHDTDYLFKIVCNKCHAEWKLCRATKVVRACVKGKAYCSYCKSKKFTVYDKYGDIIK